VYFYFCMVRISSLLRLGSILVDRRSLGGAYVVPAHVHYFNLLELLHKEYKGAVGVAMLNYCMSSCDVQC